MAGRAKQAHVSGGLSVPLPDGRGSVVVTADYAQILSFLLRLHAPTPVSYTFRAK